jgi:outer membrane protein assembly factor BamB
MEDGAVAWRAPTPSQVHYSSPAVAGGVVYVGTNESVLWALNAQTGRALWHVPAPVSESSPALANGVLYVGGGDGKLYVFDAATGATLKTLPTNGTIYVSSPVVVNGRVYVGSSDFTGPISGRLYAFGLPAD